MVLKKGRSVRVQVWFRKNWIRKPTTPPTDVEKTTSVGAKQSLLLGSETLPVAHRAYSFKELYTETVILGTTYRNCSTEPLKPKVKPLEAATFGAVHLDRGGKVCLGQYWIPVALAPCEWGHTLPAWNKRCGDHPTA